MTTIAWSGDQVAADSLSGTTDQNCSKEAVKLRVDGSTVYAITGFYAWFDAWIEWHKKGCDPKDPPVYKGNPDNTGNFIVFEGGRCFMYCVDIPYPDEQFAPQAFGSGRKFAVGAMLHGANAEEAVLAAIKADPGSGGRIQVIDLNSMDDIKPIPPESLAEMRQLAKEVDLGNAIRLLEEAGYDVSKDRSAA